jgi:RNA polymerase sigma-54 factor|tara:strand:- start:22159 stop:23487 length:1329 start_codon:yes stop_codon:yes gene_type:complete
MQKLNQKLSLKAQLSPQQIQFLNLLQTPLSLIDEKIEKELEENPALEELDENEGQQYQYTTKQKTKEQDFSNYSNESTPSLYLFLKSQIIGLNINKSQRDLISFVIDSIEENGLIKRNISSLIDDYLIISDKTVTEKEVRFVIDLIKKMEPSGVGCFSIKDSLILQVQRKKNKHKERTIEILNSHYSEFSNKNFEKIIRDLNINKVTLNEIYNDVEKLNPLPAVGFNKEDEIINYISPDFYVRDENNQLIITVNNQFQKKVGINQFYNKLLNETNDEETKKFLNQKIEQAKHFTNSLIKRQDTLLNVMTSIVKKQEKYFFSGTEKDLTPMKLADIASIVKMDISTISRVTNSKFVETSFGVFLLKELFSEAYTKKNGDRISTKEIKESLKEIIKEEDKASPYTDEKICEILEKNEYSIARRTVSKYRESLSIPTARLRRKVI